MKIRLVFAIFIFAVKITLVMNWLVLFRKPIIKFHLFGGYVILWVQIIQLVILILLCID
ncbi:Uncharacterised protein [Mycobacteroides abscessus subsp. abscessus]|nr:Uncharacterised protein [Mycobacteroides abscessus subsp. abscessus]